MTFQDIFQSSFLSRVSSVSPLDMGLALGLAFLLGLFIFLIYKKSYSGVMYSPSFGVTLIALALITTLLILAVSSNVVLSLGMVGALSIVRFRTAIKAVSYTHLISGQEHIRRMGDKSLQNLGMDYIDLYIYHMWDYQTPLYDLSLIHI